MKQSDEGGEFRWAAKFPKDDPQRFSIDCVKCFGQVDEDCVEAHVLLSSVHFSWICLTVQIMSVVLRLRRNPHCDSGRFFSTTEGISLFSIIRAWIFPEVESRDMPLWFPQSALEPLFLNNVTMVASRKSAGISSISQMLNWFHFWVGTSELSSAAASYSSSLNWKLSRYWGCWSLATLNNLLDSFGRFR